MKKNGSSEDEPSTRKRGRPAGKNRVPLTLEERRARNTQYERERRNDKAKAMAELAQAAGCESNISAPDLLATVINQIQKAAKRNTSDDIENLRRINENLMSQINNLENQLMLHCPEFDSNITDEGDSNNESDSKQPDKSFGSTSRDTRQRNKKTVGKRKRRNRIESDSQDSVNTSTEDEHENYEPKRIKPKLETEHENRSESSESYRRETRSSSSTQSSYENRSSKPDGMDHEQTHTDEQSYLTHHNMLQEELQSDNSIPITPLLVDFNIPSQPNSPSLYDCRNWSADHCVANTTQQPLPEYTQQSSEQDYNSVPSFQEVIGNEIPDDLALLPFENLNFFVEGEIDFNNDQWFDRSIFNSSALDTSGNNLIYS